MYRGVLNKPHQKEQKRVRFDDYQIQGEIHPAKDVTRDKEIGTESSMTTSSPDDVYDGKAKREWNRMFNDGVGRLHECYTMYHAMRKQYENISKENLEILEKCYQHESDNQVLQRREEKTQKEAKEWRLKCRVAEMDYILAQKDIEDIKGVNAFMVEELQLNSREIASLKNQQERAETVQERASSSGSRNKLEKEDATSSGSRNRFEKEQAATSSGNQKQAATSSGIPNKSEIEQASISSGSCNKFDKEQRATSSGSRNRIDKEQAVTSSGSVNSLQRKQTATSSGSLNTLEKAISSESVNRLEKDISNGYETTRPRIAKTTEPAVGYVDATGKYVGIDYIAKYTRRMQKEEKLKAKSLSPPEPYQKRASEKWSALDIVMEGEKQNVQNVTMSKIVHNHKNGEQPEDCSKRSSRKASSSQPTGHARTSTPLSGRVESESPIASSELQTQLDDMRKGVRMIKEVAKQRIKAMTSCKCSRKSTSGKWAAFDIVLEGGTQTVENFVNKNVRNLENGAQPAASNQRPSGRVTNISPSEQQITRKETADKGVSSKGTSLGAKVKNQYGTKGVEKGDQSATSSGSGGTSEMNITKSSQIQCADKYAAFEIPNGSQGSTTHFVTQRKQVNSGEKADPSATSSGSGGTSAKDNRDSIRRAKTITPPKVASVKRNSASNESGRTASITPPESASRTRFPPIPKCTNLIAKASSDASADSPKNDNSDDMITGTAMRSSTDSKKKKKRKKDGGVAWYHKIGKSIRSLATAVSSSASKLPKINERSSSSLGKSRSSGTFSLPKITGTKRFRSRKVVPLNIHESENGTSAIVYDGTFES